MWTNLLSALGSGARKGLGAAGSGIKKGVGVIGREFEDLFDDQSGVDPEAQTSAFAQDTRPPLTSPTNPNELMRLPKRPVELPSAPTRQNPPLAPTSTPLLSPPAAMTPKDTSAPTDYRGRQINDMGDFQQDQYVRRGGSTDAEGNFKVRRGLKDALLNAGLGFLQGASTGGGLGAGLGGAAVAGIGTAIDPTRGREYRFDMLERPRLEADAERGRKSRAQRYEDALKGGQLDKMARDAELDAANTERIRAQTESLRTPKQPTRQPPRWMTVEGDDGKPTIVDVNAPENKGKTFRPFQKPTTPKEASTSEQLRRADVEETEREGTPEEIARSSSEARRPEIIASAPAAFRSILQTGKRADGRDAKASEISQAQNWLAKQMANLYRQNLQYTRNVRAKNKARRVSNKTPSTLSASSTANLKDLEKLWEK